MLFIYFLLVCSLFIRLFASLSLSFFLISFHLIVVSLPLEQLQSFSSFMPHCHTMFSLLLCCVDGCQTECRFILELFTAFAYGTNDGSLDMRWFVYVTMGSTCMCLTMFRILVSTIIIGRFQIQPNKINRISFCSCWQNTVWWCLLPLPVAIENAHHGSPHSQLEWYK